MADSDKTLEILIKLGLIGKEDAEAAKTLLKETGEAATQSTGDALRGTEKLADGMKEGAVAAEKAEIPHRELRHVLSDIGNTVAPGAGRALGELAFGPLGAALALLSTFEVLRKSIDAASDAADKLSESLAAPDTSGIKGVQTAWDDAAKAYGDYLAKLAKAGEDNDPIKTEIERAKELTVARLEAQKKIQEATGDKAGAEYTQRSIDLTKGSSSLIAEQDAREKAQARLEADAAAKAAADEAAAQKYADDQAKLQHARDAATPGTEANKTIQKKIDDANAAAEKKTADLDEAAKNMGPAGLSGAGKDALDEMRQQVADAIATAKAAQGELDRAKKEQAQLEANQIQRNQAKAVADKAATDAADAAERNKGRLDQLPGEINQNSAVEAIKQHSDRVVEVLNTHGGILNESLSQLAQETGKTNQQTLNIVESILGGQYSLQQRIAQLEAQLSSSRGGYTSG